MSTQYYKFRRGGKPIPSNVTIIVIAVTAIVTLAQFVGPGWIGNALQLEVIKVWQGEWWRLFSYGLVHGNFLHVAMNLYMLWLLGVVYEAATSNRAFLVVYISSVLGGGIAICMMGDVLIPTVGASAGVFGVMGALIGHIYSRTGSIRGLTEVPYGRSLVMLLIFNILFSLMPGVSMLGHVGGLLPGLLLGYLIDRTLTGRIAPGEAIGAVILMIVLVGGIWYSSSTLHRKEFHIVKAANLVSLKLDTASDGSWMAQTWSSMATIPVTRQDYAAAVERMSRQGRVFDSSAAWAKVQRNLSSHFKVLDAYFSKHESASVEEWQKAFPPASTVLEKDIEKVAAPSTEQGSSPADRIKGRVD
ncbi:MAG: rhomboid family intramembrane serine protease [Planctomycetes bacterium]|nr:rhomboid family intramembrane serine protease [Planctomycetota bacterium]